MMPNDFLFIAVVCIVIFVIWWYWSIPKNLPPGPLGLPILGCMLQVRPESAHITLTEWSKKYGPLFSFYQGNRLVVVLADVDVMQEALLRQGDHYSGKATFFSIPPRPSKHGVLGSEGERWKEHRRFALSTLRDFGFGRPILEPIILDEAAELLAAMKETNGQPFDPQSLLSNAVSNVICTMIFGHRFTNDSQLKKQLDEMNFRTSQSQQNTLSAVAVYTWIKYVYFPFSETMKKFVTGVKAMHKFALEEIENSRRNFDPKSSQQPECYVHAYDKATLENYGNYFTDIQLMAMIEDLFIAGSDTTSTTLRWALLYMARNVDIQNEVRKEILEKLGPEASPSYADRTKLPLTEATIMEVQRIANLLPLSLMHKTTETTVLFGYDIPEETSVLPLLWAVHYNEKYFPQPEKFNPRRFLDEKNVVKRDAHLVPFSVGKRICLGESLARMELLVLFVTMIQHFEFTFPSDQSPPTGKPFVGFIMSPPSFEICARPVQA